MDTIVYSVITDQHTCEAEIKKHVSFSSLYLNCNEKKEVKTLYKTIILTLIQSRFFFLYTHSGHFIITT